MGGLRLASLNALRLFYAEIGSVLQCRPISFACKPLDAAGHKGLMPGVTRVTGGSQQPP